MPDRPPCSATSLALAEPLLATASTVRAWVLLEQPGPWGKDALVQSRLPVKAGRALGRWARGAAVRLLLVREPGGGSGLRRTCLLVHTGTQVCWIERLELDEPLDLLDVDPALLHDAAPPGLGADVAEPQFIVCTNGRHDSCCAKYGRSVARAAAAAVPGRAWESTHLGGDRFAANLVCFPHGLYYGRLDPASAVVAIERYHEGRIDLDHYRGRSSYAFAVQAAEHFLRQHLLFDGVDDLSLTGRRALDGDVVEAVFETPAGTVTVRVQTEEAPVARPLTCHVATDSHPPTYRLVAME